MQRARLVNIAAMGGVVALLTCIALVVIAGMSSSSRGTRANRAYNTYRMHLAELDCGWARSSASEKMCAPAADALVLAWREVQRGVPWYERAGAVLARAVGIQGFGVPFSLSFVDEIDAAVRRWPLARERAGLDE